MSDFYQTGTISTLHKIGREDVSALEEELRGFSKSRPLSLILPAIYEEFERPALPRILKELEGVDYLREIVLVMNKTSAMQFREAKRHLSGLPYPVKIVWSSGERIGKLYDHLEREQLSLGEDGKGRSVWIALGYLIAQDHSEAIALHDCDILTYDRGLLARLCYPLGNPNLGYEFCKGYYSRVTDRLHGRVTRLFFIPMIRSIIRILGHLPLLDYLNSFRYPLAGEFSLDIHLSRINRIPSDWGLEVGMLSEVYRNCAQSRICQVDLAEVYEHKHQELLSDDPTRGLLKMCIDITKSVFRTVAQEGVILSEAFMHTFEVTYLRMAQNIVKQYEDDASINHLYFDRHAESGAVETFARGIEIAAKEFWQNPRSSQVIPNWNRVTSAIPDILEQLNEAVELDNK
ncbi:MAG: glycosyl transferase [candidate division Zixibacteria bacterium]|nr:glycosyl transferase [candidate division Zixibacteria bacterium]